jgi:hypothetical protein
MEVEDEEEAEKDRRAFGILGHRRSSLIHQFLGIAS